MNIRNLVNATVRKQDTPERQKGEATPVSTTTVETRISTFLTPQTLATFPGASLAIAVVDKLYDTLVPSHANSPWPVAIIGVLVGGFIIWLSVTDSNVTVPRDRTILVVVGVFNTLFLIASALGLQVTASTVAGAGGAPAPTPPTTGT
ncbi:MAG TPA: hypothetical protein VF618_21385 [Thermoanaerobaculia bacterium]